MRFDPERHHRQSHRLRGHDYAAPGGYFVTVCTARRECLMGEVCGADVVLSDVGAAVADVWEQLPRRFPTVTLDVSQVMPNHFHGILFLCQPAIKAHAADESEQAPGPSPLTLGAIVGAFKSISGIAANRVLGITGVPFWQRDFYDHVIRDADGLARIRRYVRENPLHWATDADNPDADTSL